MTGMQQILFSRNWWLEEDVINRYDTDKTLNRTCIMQYTLYTSLLGQQCVLHKVFMVDYVFCAAMQSITVISSNTCSTPCIDRVHFVASELKDPI